MNKPTEIWGTTHVNLRVVSRTKRRIFT